MSPTRNNDQFKSNNFDLLRLLAATQVALHHALTHFQMVDTVPTAAGWLLKVFPGVPVFFFISGFLISRSYEVNSRLRDFAINRMLRIYPGLIVCFLGSLLIVAVSGYYGTFELPGTDFLLWCVAQLSFIQYWNPEFMRGFGTGVLNGSLWTITVELQFYVLVPVLYFATTSLARRRKHLDQLLVGAVFIVSLSMFLVLSDLKSETLAVRLANVSFLPWLWMFLFGVLVQRSFPLFHQLLAGRVWVCLPCYVAVALCGTNYFGWHTGNNMHPIMFVLLASVIFSAAYTLPGLANRVLGRNDFSYGIYIWHMPIINLLVYLEFSELRLSMFLMVTATFGVAVFSWIVIERPAMGLKKHPLNPLDNLLTADGDRVRPAGNIS